jgi:hypothetical protein
MLDAAVVANYWSFSLVLESEMISQFIVSIKWKQHMKYGVYEAKTSQTANSFVLKSFVESKFDP